MIAEQIRGRMGFGGLLISDDLDMKALSGDIPARAAAVLAAGAASCGCVLRGCIPHGLYYGIAVRVYRLCDTTKSARCAPWCGDRRCGDPPESGGRAQQQQEGGLVARRRRRTPLSLTACSILDSTISYDCT